MVSLLRSMTQECTQATGCFEEVPMPAGCASLDGVYGVSPARRIWLPKGVKGQELWAQAKQSEEERRECKRRGAEFDIKRCP